jgi:hypothetical protein
MEEKRSVEEMLNQISESSEEVKPKNTKKILVIILAIIVVCAGCFFVYKAIPKNQAVERQSKIDDIMSNKKDSDENYSVIDLPKWAKTGYSDLTDEDIEAMVNDQKENFIGWTAEGLPSEEQGFTSDKDKEFDEDGLPNEMYTNLTKENFTEKASIAIYRIINPVFGEWDVFQEPFSDSLEEAYISVYRDLGSTEYVQDLIDGKNKNSVIYLDSNKNNYDNKLKNVNKRGAFNKFVGIIKRGDISFDSTSNTMLVDIDVDYMSSKNTIFKSRNLKLTFKYINDRFILVGGTVNDK